MAKVEPRPEIAGMPLWVAGPAGEARTPSILLASNENPYGPSPRVVEAVASRLGGVNRYPESHPAVLQEAIAARWALRPEQIVLGSGADQLIRLLALAYLTPGSTVIAPRPSFPAYALAARLVGAQLRSVGLTAAGAMDLDAFERAVDASTRLVFLCSPNNPTGGIADAADLPAFLSRLAERGVLTVVDEAYGEFADDDAEYRSMLTAALAQDIPTVVLRTFSKAYGLAGLRIGWAAAPVDAADALRRVREPFAVNGLAHAAAAAAWADTDWRDEVVARTRRTRAAFMAAVAARHLSAFPSHTNFVAVTCHPDTAAVTAAFLAEGIQVRPTDAFGLPAHIRVTMGTDAEMAAFWPALDAVDRLLPFPRRPHAGPG